MQAQSVGASYTRGPMDDERWMPGMPVLDRQVRPEHEPGAGTGGEAGRDRTPAPAPISRVPETRPTPLRQHYINLSAIGLVAGAIAITALELGTPLGSPLVKLCVVVGAPLLTVAMGDAALRVWRSAWAWMPVNRGRGLFRLAWVASIAIIFAILVAASWAVLTA